MATELPANMIESPNDSQVNSNPQSSASTPDGISYLECLPNEVLINIIRNCETENATSVARNLCLVSKRVEPVARQELYRSIAITTQTGLRKLTTTLIKKSEFGQYIVELELLVRIDRSRSTGFGETTKATFVLFLQYFEVLKRSSNLMRLTMILGDYIRDMRSKRNTCQRLFGILSDALTQSQQSGPTTAVLPRLEKLLLKSHAQFQPGHWSSNTIVSPEFFKCFLDLPSLSSLECISDSGSWGNSVSSVPHTGSSTNLANAANYQKIKSVVLRQSKSDAEDLAELIKMFPALEVLFVQSQIRSSMFDWLLRPTATQQKASQSEIRYLSDSFGKLQHLKNLAYVPHRAEYEFPNEMQTFLGPSNYLSLKKLRNLTSLAVLVNVFTSPKGSSTSRLTVSPLEALPDSLKSFQLVVDHQTARDSRVGTDLSKDWFQPRVAAVVFMEEMASICPAEFPRLRQVEYIWAVTRHTGAQSEQNQRRRLRSGDVSFPIERRIKASPCDGSKPLCCDVHARIQALSPDVDYTSTAGGIVSPFRERFDSLKLAFDNVGITFEVVELKHYDDFFFHWRGD